MQGERTVFIAEAAVLLGVSRRTVYNRIRDGRLDTVRTAGGSRRVRLMSIERLLRQERRLPPVPDVVADRGWWTPYSPSRWRFR